MPLSVLGEYFGRVNIQIGTIKRSSDPVLNESAPSFGC